MERWAASEGRVVVAPIMEQKLVVAPWRNVSVELPFTWTNRHWATRTVKRWIVVIGVHTSLRISAESSTIRKYGYQAQRKATLFAWQYTMSVRCFDGSVFLSSLVDGTGLESMPSRAVSSNLP